MEVYHLKSTQVLPLTLQQAWDFFSSPKNLAIITPREMNFKILSMSGGEKMYAGQIISYAVTVMPWIRVRWVTEITHVQEPEFFTDEQRFGPYAFWHHKHHFTTVNDGVLMTDEVDYALPWGFLGQFAHWLFVAREVNRIFDYRNKVLETYFGKKN